VKLKTICFATCGRFSRSLKRPWPFLDLEIAADYLRLP
jgi:hypothetical protein